MTRSHFQSLFSVGFLIVLIVENPWFRINALLSQPSFHLVGLTTQFWIAVAVSAYLVVVAGVRGRSIGRPYLLLLPVLAFVIGGVRFLKTFVPIDGLVLVTTLGPFLANLACYVLGSSGCQQKNS